ncbi:MAG: hypothetical protein ACM3N0_09910 [Chloroflexota bacterium]
MPVIGPARARLRRLRRSESGIALPTALFAMIATMALASAAVLSSVDVQQGSHRDHDAKEAIAAADAGANVALTRLNRFLSDITAATPCIGPAGEAQEASGGWCPETTSESVGEAGFTYRVSAWDGTETYKVVAVGTAGEVSRRIEVGMASYSGGNVFANEKVLGESGIEMEGTPDIRTDIGTNGSITSSGSGTICGNVRHGEGGTAPEPDCDGEVSEGNQSMPELKPPENIATENSNCRLVPSCTGENPAEEVDPYTKTRTSKVPWEASTRTIKVNQNGKLTMGGSDYFVCGLFLESGELIMAAGANVRIFVDTPEHCGLASGAVQVKVTGNGAIVSTGFNPAQGSFDVPGIYLLGDGSVELEGNSNTNELVLYAPQSEVDIGGSATWNGMFAGKSLTIHGTPRIESDPSIPLPDINWETLLERTRYVECTGGTGPTPDASC